MSPDHPVQASGGIDSKKRVRALSDPGETDENDKRARMEPLEMPASASTTIPVDQGYPEESSAAVAVESRCQSFDSPVQTSKENGVAKSVPGVFEDAEADEVMQETSKPEAGTPPVEPSKNTHVQPNREPLPGIFDDADEDETFDLSLLKTARTSVVPMQASSLLLPAKAPILRPDLAAAILGQSPASIPVRAPVALKNLELPKKRQPKQTRKVLIGKREQEAADKAIRGTIDLARIISKYDCNFLADKMWIFTLQQLEYVISEKNEDSGVNERRSQLRNELESHLAALEPSKAKKTSINNLGEEGAADNGHCQNVVDEEPAMFGGDQLLEGKKLPTPVDSGSMPDSTNEHTSQTSTFALKKMEEWREIIKDWRSNRGSKEIPEKEQFPLSGTISHLMPPCTRNFIASTKLKFAYDFLCLKRTETGIVVDMYRLWRKKCNLHAFGALAIAKHLNAVGMRIETVLASEIPCDKDSRQWMGGNMIVLTGSAKDFFFSGIKLLDAETFVERRTKDLADILVDWRESKGLPLLKGTGKVAMISGWKSLVKEAREVEAFPGFSIKGVDLLKEVEKNAPVRVAEKKMKPDKGEKVTFPKKSTGGSVGAPIPVSQRLVTSLFNANLASLLQSCDIRTGGDLLATENTTSSLHICISGIEPNSQRFRDLFGDMESKTTEDVVRRLCNDVRSKAKSSSKPPSKKLTSPQQPKELTSQANVPKKVFANAFDALSNASKAFLATIGIRTAEEFLASKTTDVANTFIKYREERKMNPLKGLGAVASVSGWKALVRKAAKDSGQADLVALNAGRNAGIKLNRKAKNIVKVEAKAEENDALKYEERTDYGLLGGEVRRRFWVKGANDFFCFELSVRVPHGPKSEPAVFVTYIGNQKKAGGSLISPPKGGLRLNKMKILEKVVNHGNVAPCANFPFSATMPDGGLIELSQFGLKPREQDDKLAAARFAIKRFVLGGFYFRGKGLEEWPTPSTDETSYNVFERRFSGRKEFFLLLRKPLECGQTTELRYAPWQLAKFRESELTDTDWRVWIVEELSLLSLKQLRELLDYLNKEVGGIAYRRFNIMFDVLKDSTFETEEEIVSRLNARRRMHWVALRINSQLQKEFVAGGGGSNMILPQVALAPLWTQELVSKIRQHRFWKDKYLPLVLREVDREMMSDFELHDFGKFFIPRENWCSLGEQVFDETKTVFKHFSLELTSLYSDEELVAQVCTIFSKALAKMKWLCEHQDRSNLSKLSMEGVDIDLLPSRGSAKILESATPRSPETLESERGTPKRENQEPQRVLVVQKESNSESKMDTEDSQKLTGGDMLASQESIDFKWYTEHQLISICECVKFIAAQNIALKLPSLVNFQQRLCEVAGESLNIEIGRVRVLPTFRLPSRSVAELPTFFNSHGPRGDCFPNSEHFFLSLVWPALKRLKWRLEAGAERNDVSLIPPGKKRDKRTRLLKQEAAKQRAHYARKSTELGLGYIPKPVKRLFIACANNEAKRSLENNNLSVRNVLKSFNESLAQQIALSDKNVQGSVEKIIDSVSSLFEDIAESLLYSEELKNISKLAEEKWVDVLDCVPLVRLLQMMPGMLNHSDLSMSQVEDTVGIITELLKYLVSCQDKHFPSSVHLPREEYERIAEFPDFLSRRCDTAVSTSTSTDVSVKPNEGPAPNLKEIVLPSDRTVLTDFVVVVMSQLMVCRATQEDLNRKGRRVMHSVGHPGLVCRHCLGVNGEGRYFFSNVSSLSTAATSIDKHILRCSKIGDDIKSEVMRAKAMHSEQQRSAPAGAQSAYFARLWERLQASRTAAGAEADMYVTLSTNTPPTTDTMSEEQASSSQEHDSGFEFKDRVALVTYLQTTSPWKESDELQNAVARYHSCIYVGGRLYKKRAAPKNLTESWILAKYGKSIQPMHGVTD